MSKKSLKTTLIICFLSIFSISCAIAMEGDQEGANFKKLSAFPVKNLGSPKANFEGDLIDLEAIINTIKTAKDDPLLEGIIAIKIEDYKQIISEISEDYKEDARLKDINYQFEYLTKK